jgi:hypothetical protein
MQSPSYGEYGNGLGVRGPDQRADAVRRDGARGDDATATLRTPGRVVARVPILTFSPSDQTAPASRQQFRLIHEYAPILAPLRRTCPG